MALLDEVIERIADLDPVALHAAVAGLAFAETALFLDLLVPGEVGMVLAGAGAARGDVPLAGLVAAGAVGATIGDSVSYVVGRAAGAGRLPGSHWLLRHSTRARPRAEQLFAEHGGRAVFLGRWVGALRAVVPFVAGLSRMSYGRFLVWNVLASVSWVTAVLTTGYLAGEAVADLVDRVSLGLSIVVVTAIAVVWFLRRRSEAGSPG